MSAQEFDRVRGPLLEAVERLVVAQHAAIHRDLLGEQWSPPAAYRWMRYEDPDPIRQLINASRALDGEWPGHEAERDKFWQVHERDLLDAVGLARRLGFR